MERLISRAHACLELKLRPIVQRRRTRLRPRSCPLYPLKLMEETRMPLRRPAGTLNRLRGSQPRQTRTTTQAGSAASPRLFHLGTTNLDGTPLQQIIIVEERALVQLQNGWSTAGKRLVRRGASARRGIALHARNTIRILQVSCRSSLRCYAALCGA